MEGIIGRGSNDDRFTAFLANWERVLDWRVEQVRTELASVGGVTGVVLADSLGRGAPLPLSDIDLVLSLEAGHDEVVRAAVDAIGVRLYDQWAGEGR